MDQTSIPLWDAEWVGYDPWVRRADELPKQTGILWCPDRGFFEFWHVNDDYTSFHKIAEWPRFPDWIEFHRDTFQHVAYAGSDTKPDTNVVGAGVALTDRIMATSPDMLSEARQSARRQMLNRLVAHLPETGDFFVRLMGVQVLHPDKMSASADLHFMPQYAEPGMRYVIARAMWLSIADFRGYHYGHPAAKSTDVDSGTTVHETE